RSGVQAAPMSQNTRTEVEDSLSDEAFALCCQPLEVGLASEARSTTGTLAKSEGRRRERERSSLRDPPESPVRVSIKNPFLQ
ncbi:MAG: hypothetical protein WAK31_11970, partial [Chthoniobacterales bacterium]